MIARSIHQIFKKLEHNIDIEYSVRVSHMEIYNEELIDLLAPDGNDAKTLKMLEHPTNGVCVHNLQEVPVASSDAIFKVLRISNKKRTTAATKMNVLSSRSHCIFTITVHTKETTIDGEEVVRVGKLNLVDLAGSENISKSGGNKRETGNINQSLLALGRVIKSLVEGRGHVPYRESKLTRLLQESLGGRAKTSIIATVAPTASNYEETLSTLDYAHTAKSITNKPQNNNMMTKKALIKDYTSEIERLKQRLLATREKNGVYVPPEEHERTEAEMAANKERLTELEAQLEMKSAQLEELSTMFSNTRMELKSTTSTLQTASAALEETQQKLSSTHITLNETQSRLEDTKAVVAARVANEEALRKDAERLLDVLEERESDVEGLHAKIGRKVTVDGANMQITADFRAYLSERVDAVSGKVTSHTDSHTEDLAQLRGQLCDFMAAKTGDIDSMCERLDSLQNMIVAQQAEMIALVQKQLNESSAAVAQVGKSEQHERARALQALTDYAVAAARSLEDWRNALHEQASQLAQFQAASTTAIEQARAAAESALQKQKTELTDLKSVSAKDNEANAEWVAKTTTESSRAHDAQMVSAEEGKKTLVAQIGQLFAQFVTDSNADLAKVGDALMADVVKENKAVAAQNVAVGKTIDTHMAAVGAYRAETESALSELSGSTSAKVGTDVARIADNTTRASLWSQSVENLLAETGASSSKYGEHTTSKLGKVRETNSAFSRQHSELSQLMQAQAQQSNEDLQGQLFYVSETCTNLNYAIESQSTEGKKTLDGWSARMESDVTGMEDRFDNYYYSIKEYAPTGATPVKRPLPIVRELPTSLPIETIKEMYWDKQIQGEAVSSPVHVPAATSSALVCTPVSAASAATIANLAILNVPDSPASEVQSTPLANLSRAIESARQTLSGQKAAIVQPVFEAAKAEPAPVATVAVVETVTVAASAPAPAPVAEKDEEEEPAVENKPANKKAAAAGKTSKHPFVKSKKPDATLIKKLTVKDLKAYLAEEKLSDKGKKEELVERIVSHLTI